MERKLKVTGCLGSAGAPRDDGADRAFYGGDRACPFLYSASRHLCGLNGRKLPIESIDTTIDAPGWCPLYEAGSVTVTWDLRPRGGVIGDGDQAPPAGPTRCKDCGGDLDGHDDPRQVCRKCAGKRPNV